MAVKKAVPILAVKKAVPILAVKGKRYEQTFVQEQFIVLTELRRQLVNLWYNMFMVVYGSYYLLTD